MPDFLSIFSLLLAAAFGAAFAILALRARFASQLSEVHAAKSTELAGLARDHEQRMRVALDEAKRIHSSEQREIKSQLEISALQTQRDIQEKNAAALRLAEEQFNIRLKEQSQSTLSVTVHPFVNTSRQRGLLTSETLVEVGYKYQLLIQGLPCFEPHTVVVETTREKEVNDEAIELLKSKAVELAQLAASAKGGGLAGTAFSIAKAVVQRIK